MAYNDESHSSLHHSDSVTPLGVCSVAAVAYNHHHTNKDTSQ